MQKFLVGFVLLVSVAVLAGCGSGDYIEVRGSDTMVNLGQHFAEAFMESNPEISLSVTGGGSGTGIAALINDTVDIAQSSRKIKQEERDDAADHGVEVHEFIVGQDAVSIIVNKDNPLREITLADLKDIFTGKISTWSELGWDGGGNITLYSRQSNSGTYVFFWETVMNEADWADETMYMPGTSAIYEAVVADSNGIGYVGVSYVREEVHALKVAREETGPFVDPLIRANVDDGSYPIARPLYFYINGVPEGAVLEYLQWVLSDEGKKVLEATGFYANTLEYEQQNSDTFQRLGIR